REQPAPPRLAAGVAGGVAAPRAALFRPAAVRAGGLAALPRRPAPARTRAHRAVAVPLPGAGQRRSACRRPPPPPRLTGLPLATGEGNRSPEPPRTVCNEATAADRKIQPRASASSRGRTPGRQWHFSVAVGRLDASPAPGAS